MKDRTTTYIALIIGGLAFIQFIALPAIRDRTSGKVITSILSDWQDANGITPMTHWANRKQYPNVPKLVTYRIRNRQVLKKDGKLSARFVIKLSFVENPTIHQNSDWLFVLNKIDGRWKVTEFRLSKLHPSDIKRQAARYDAAADRKRLQQMEDDRKRRSEEQKQAEARRMEERKAAASKPLRPIRAKIDEPDDGQQKRPGYRSIPAMVD